MKAAFYEQPGPPDVIRYGDLPDPQPKAGQALVKVAAASLNPIDTYIRSGLVKFSQPVPTIPGCDLAGTVVALGPGAKRFKVGDRVWGSNQGLLGRQGAFAELAAVGEEWLYPTPNGAKDDDAAAAALVGITAHLGLFRFATLKAGETVFVNGGTGGVGSMVIQMAKAVGARAITTVGSAEKAGLARQLGAEFVINYKTDDVPAKVKEFTGGKGVEVWYETQPPNDLDKTFDAMAFRGRVILMAGRQARPAFPNGGFYTKDLAMFGFAMFKATADEQRRCAEDISRWLAEKKLRVTVGKSFPLSEAVAAHRLQEENTQHKAGTLTGKIIVKP
jgi:NADPH2:quinone reductase